MGIGVPGRDGWRVAAATAAGSSHLRSGVRNQDAVAHRIVETGRGQVVVAAVSDGAGSAARSDEGSRIAVTIAVGAVVRGIEKRPAAALVEHLATSLVRMAVKRARNEVVRYSRRQNLEPRELASTLIVAIASDRLITAAQVGDGAVVAFNLPDGTARTLCAAHTGEHANETTFITSRTRPHRIASVGCADGSDWDALALITDGLQNLALKMPEREAFMGFWRPLLNDLAQTDKPEAVPGRLYSFISGERVQSRTGDDVTIAIATRNPRNHREDRI